MTLLCAFLHETTCKGKGGLALQLNSTSSFIGHSEGFLILFYANCILGLRNQIFNVTLCWRCWRTHSYSSSLCWSRKQSQVVAMKLASRAWESSGDPLIMVFKGAFVPPLLLFPAKGLCPTCKGIMRPTRLCGAFWDWKPLIWSLLSEECPSFLPSHTTTVTSFFSCYCIVKLYNTINKNCSTPFKGHASWSVDTFSNFSFSCKGLSNSQ